MKLILVRHAETEANAKGINPGKEHGELTILGKKQAELLAECLKSHKIDKVYSSDFPRAVYTTEQILTKINSPTEYVPDYVSVNWVSFTTHQQAP